MFSSQKTIGSLCWNWKSDITLNRFYPQTCSITKEAHLKKKRINNVYAIDMNNSLMIYNQVLRTIHTYNTFAEDFQSADNIKKWRWSK